MKVLDKSNNYITMDSKTFLRNLMNNKDDIEELKEKMPPEFLNIFNIK